MRKKRENKISEDYEQGNFLTIKEKIAIASRKETFSWENNFDWEFQLCMYPLFLKLNAELWLCRIALRWKKWNWILCEFNGIEFTKSLLRKIHFTKRMHWTVKWQIVFLNITINCEIKSNEGIKWVFPFSLHTIHVISRCLF